MNWNHLPIDEELFHRELASFVPKRIYDAHAHLYSMAHMSPPLNAVLVNGPEPAGWEAYASLMQWILPGRDLSGLFFAFPSPGLDINAANAFVSAEVKGRSRGQMLIHPDMDPEFIRETVRAQKSVGLKCYHVYASTKPSFDAEIPAYLPEAHYRIAHEEGLAITLHMVRSRALVDPVNQQHIRTFATRYPNARLILAHAARGFNPHHTIEGIHSLKGLQNVWFDTSAVTDGGAIEAIIDVMGSRRVLYGSDFPVSHLRGRCVAMGDSFVWLDSENAALKQPMGMATPTLVGLESLRVLKLCCQHLRLRDSEIEAIFHDNAAELLQL